MVTVLYVIIGLPVGIMVALVVAFLVLSHLHSKRQDRAQLWGAEYGMRQVQRANVKIRILSQIGGPECPDGRYSPLQLALWNRYYEVDAQDREWTARERNEIVELRGYS